LVYDKDVTHEYLLASPRLDSWMSLASGREPAVLVHALLQAPTLGVVRPGVVLAFGARRGNRFSTEGQFSVGRAPATLGAVPSG
jgi:hypothetical protein